MDSSTKLKIIETQKEILQALVQWEERIAELYDRYVLLFPETAELWNTLAQEERSHAVLLGSLKAELMAGYLFWNIGRFRKEAVLSEIAVLEQAMARADSGKVRQKEALLLAVEIESSLLDSQFYTVVRSESPGFNRVAGILARAGVHHRDRINRSLCEQEPGKKWI